MKPTVTPFQGAVLGVWKDGERNRAEIARVLNSRGIDATASGVKGAVRQLIQKGVILYEPGANVGYMAQRKAPQIDGLTPEDHLTDGAEVLKTLVTRQKRAEKKRKRRHEQVVTLPGRKPVALAILSDLHLGNANVDYKAIKADAELIRDTDGLYACACGDYHDNWVGKLVWVANDQPVTLENELALVQWWLDTLGEKLVAAVAGNHESRTKRAAGFDHMKLLMRGANHLYDADEIPFTLKLGRSEWGVKVRHKWRGNSMYNESHGMERDLRFGLGDWDIAMQGHVHRGTIFRESYDDREEKAKLTCQIGTYEFSDRYAMQLGFAQRPQSGCGAILFYPDGRYQPFRDLETAADFLEYLRS